jgi:uncharacterized protein
VHDRYVRRYDDRRLSLIVMPTEQCNFRCVYCYESFLRGEMSAEIQEGLKRFVAGQQNLESFTLSWFGGEPLLAREVVAGLSEHFQRFCADRGIAYAAQATTNAYLLTPEYAERIIAAGVRHFQITLDGVPHEHDKRRIGADGAKTFARIWENLQYLRSTDIEFNIALRHNFDPDGLPRLPEFLEMLKAEFGGDPRFATLMRPIGKWGGPNDSQLNVCEGRSANQAWLEARRLSVEAGFRDASELASMQPDGYVCYAANPRSFVIGSDGKVYKCTVELDYHDRNIVGQLHHDGEMSLDWQKMALWLETDGMDEGKKCTSCYFSPSCHGAVCPKEWMDEVECACPPTKHNIKETLTLIRVESLFAPPPVTAAIDCPRD